MGDAEAAVSPIPNKCKACVVINEGPDFQVEVQDVDVPEPGMDFSVVKNTLLL